MMQDPNMVDMNGQPMMAQDGQQHFIDGQMQGQYTQEQLEVSQKEAGVQAWQFHQK